MKKSTVKAAKSPATAKKTPSKLVKKPAAAAPVKKAAAVKAVKKSPTVITAVVDIGFGNTLYVRGEGPGLSWDVGVPMDCVADDKWTLSLPAGQGSVTYKVLVNDLTWSVGEDYIAGSGQSVTVSPAF